MRNMYEAGIRIVNDLMSIDGNLMTLEELHEKYPVLRIDFLRYEDQGLKNAIPAQWKYDIRLNPNVRLSNEQKKCCLVNLKNETHLCIKHLKSQHIYDCL